MSRLARALALAMALPAASPALAGKRPLRPDERVDLNRAGLSELMRLPGVGEKRARAILAHRERRPFHRPEDVLAVKGLGPAWFAKVKGHLSIGVPEPARPAGQPPRGAGR